MSNNFAYYLKYRPQALSELIGQEAVKKTLSSSFKNNKLAHAYLFVGPRGTGKTSTARILAKMVNCEQSSVVSRPAEGEVRQRRQSSDYPCNKCSACVSITDGSNLDLIEIDAASNRSIEDIRSLREKTKLAPTSARKKVYIIDEVHQLTSEAFNALLKTLEEPPNHTLFILATTELKKIPQTILSRAQRLDFKLASPEELSEALRRIVQGEKINIDEEALKILVSKAEGSFRDGIKLLDQVSSLGEKITAKLIDENLKFYQFDDILKLVQSLKEKKAETALLYIGQQIEHGVDVRELVLSLMETFRNLALIKNGVGEQLVKTQFTEDKYQKFLEVAESFTSQELVRNLNILQEAMEKLKFTSIPSLPLELAVVEICGSQTQNSPASPSEAGRANVAPSPKLWSVGDKSQNYSEKKSEQPLHLENGVKMDKSVVESFSIGGDTSDLSKIKEKWTFVLETVRPFNFSLEALLRSINITDCTDNLVIIEVPYSFHQRILEVPKNRDLLEGVLSDILGRSIRISIHLGSRPERREDIANVEIAADDEIIRAAAEIFNSDSIN